MVETRVPLKLCTPVPCSSGFSPSQASHPQNKGEKGRAPSQRPWPEQREGVDGERERKGTEAFGWEPLV